VVISTLQRGTAGPGAVNHALVINGIGVDGDQVELGSVGIGQATISAGVTCTINQSVSGTAPGTGTAISFGFMYIFIPAE
jgi:hypothetical protein